MARVASLRSGAILAAIAAFLVSACSTSGLQFREDDRVEILSPAYREKVELPFTIEWEADDFEITGPTAGVRDDAGYFAVLIDAEPLPPGETLDYYGRGDTSCRPEVGCPDEAYLAARGVHATIATKFHVDRLAPAPGVDVARGEPDRHEVTIVLLDGHGRRIGESVWIQPFEVVRT